MDAQALQGNTMKPADQKNLQRSTLRRIVLLLLLLFLLVYLVSVVYTSTDFFHESAGSNAFLRLSDDLNEADALIAEHYANLQAVADRLEPLKTKAEIDSVMGGYIGSETFGDLRYYVGGSSYACDGTLVPEEANAEIDDLSAARTQGAVLFFDSVIEQDCIAFFLPVKSTSLADGVLSIVPIRDRETGKLLLDLTKVLDADASAVALVGADGRILLGTTADGFATLGNNMQSFMADFISSNEDAMLVIDALSKSAWHNQPVRALSGEQYSVYLAPIPSLNDSAKLVVICKNEALIENEMLFIRHVAILLIVAIAAFIAVFVYSVLYHKQAKKEISIAMLTDQTLECPNVEQFRRNAIEVVYSQKQTYAVLFYQLRRLYHIVETLGEQKVVEIFRFVAKVFESFCTLGETYGYAGDGNFLLLNRYQSEKQLSEKVRLLEAVINKSDLVRDCGISIKFTVGAYLTSQGKRTLPQMIECATLAAQSAKSGISQPYVLYTDAVNEEIARNERIEAQMENALSSGEFRLFLQPKYSVKNDQIDSAEALVRWFDPTKGEYRFPAAFIGLFESNGFIIKLDHFIYLEVLKYMSHAAERGERIVPVSINVSRVTAMSDDFLDFYIGNKKRYQIGDRFITLELTESFAMGNYEQLLEIVNKLHENGIRCSIDDFGLGYSSFSIIKEVPIDELKLDRLFLSKGLSDARDNKILQSMIKLAKDIGVDIVQEGVETEEMFKRVVEMGCDVIQGYYYAKAISLEEYRIFLNTNTSIKYKAKVK